MTSLRRICVSNDGALAATVKSIPAPAQSRAIAKLKSFAVHSHTNALTGDTSSVEAYSVGRRGEFARCQTLKSRISPAPNAERNINVCELVHPTVCMRRAMFCLCASSARSLIVPCFASFA